MDSKHKYVYDDYNSIVKKIGLLAEDVYFFKLNEMVFNNPSLECYHFQVYHPGYNNHFIVSFFIKTKQNNQILQDIDSTLTDEFIQTTASNFKQLVDVSVLEDKNLEHVLKKKINNTK